MPNVKALLQLKRVVEAAPDELLHMRFWRDAAECGTARCAAGWASVDAWFNDRGLRACVTGAPYFDSEAGDPALRKFFRLTENQTAHLFATNHPTIHKGDAHAVTKRQVLNQIDRILAGEPTRHYRVRRSSP